MVHDDPATKNIKLKHGLRRLKFEIKKEDLSEKFVKGFGPGGQKTNKSNNCVILTHMPTGEVVKCHDAREQHTTRAIARKILYERLDLFVNPDSSTVSIRMMKKQRNKSKAIQRRNQAAKVTATTEQEAKAALPEPTAKKVKVQTPS